MGILDGLGFGLGFFTSFFVIVFVVAIIVAAIKKKRKAKASDFSIKAFQNYARTLRDNEQYEELEDIRNILDAMHQGEAPDTKLLEPYEMKTESKLKVKGSSMSIQKTEYIIKKPGFDKKKNKE